MTTTTLPTYDPRALAVALAAAHLPGARSATAIRQIRRERAARKLPAPAPVPLVDRLTARLTTAALAEITRRGGETTIDGRGTVTTVAIEDRDRSARMVLMHAEGWRFYSRRHGSHRATLAYLCGADDAGPWAVRVPGTITTVRAALAWITPAEVTAARVAGRRVLRQGDVYAVELAPGTAHRDGAWTADTDAEVRAAHQLNPTTRYLTHRPADGRRHRPVRVSFPALLVAQRVYGMGRGAGRTNGD